LNQDFQSKKNLLKMPKYNQVYFGEIALENVREFYDVNISLTVKTLALVSVV
jgi:hypothetical protein